MIHSLVGLAASVFDTDPTTVGYCPECGAEIQQQRDETYIRAPEDSLLDSNRLRSGYRCPNDFIGRHEGGSIYNHCRNPRRNDNKSVWFSSELLDESEGDR
jgi:hypothetical protein